MGIGKELVVFVGCFSASWRIFGGWEGGRVERGWRVEELKS